jgi:hypothetical protein
VETESEKARWEQKTRKKRKTIFAEFGERICDLMSTGARNEAGCAFLPSTRDEII